MKTVGIIGGSGFTGAYITKLLLKKGHKVIIFTRSPSQKNALNLLYAQWDKNKGSDTSLLSQVDAVINLAGAGIADKRWTEQRKKEIAGSRIEGTQFLIEQLKLHAPGCNTFIGASATGFYGADKGSGHSFTETAPAATDFLGNTCAAWEQASLMAARKMRTVIFRFGIVLGRSSGAYPRLAAPLSFGIMPILGSGRQVVSWIHVCDLAAMLLLALEHENISGIYNAVAPLPVTHKELMLSIAQVKGGVRIPAYVPSFILKIMLGEMSCELLKSCNVSAGKILDTGFKFCYPEIRAAITAIAHEKKN